MRGVNVMSIKQKKYDGYESYSYLEAGKDYKPYKLSRQHDRVEPFIYPISEEEEEKVGKIFDEHLIISLHEHNFVTTENLNELSEFRRHGSVWTGHEELSLSGLDVVVEIHRTGMS